MKIGVFVKNKSYIDRQRLQTLEDGLKAAGCELYPIHSREDVVPGSDMVLSVGGDGTFLSASKRVADSGIPILGINFGRMGFLSATGSEEALEAILSGDYEVESRDMLRAELSGFNPETVPGYWPYSLNEITLHRSGPAVLGIEVRIDDSVLPTYWADGLLIATSSGSTAYSLSVGGPICMPDSRVLIISPIAPHNLNVRPLVVPNTSKITISAQTRDEDIIVTMDNRSFNLNPSCRLTVSMAQFSLKRIRLSRANFVNALTSKLFWGEDIRNNS